ncbi:MAG: hypothetical protein ACO1RT_07475 [Planctomycetaceae bacterium]
MAQLLAALIVIATPIVASARPVPALSIQELHKRSDVVVVCSPTKVEHKPELDSMLIDEKWRDYFTVTRTTFHVVVSLKGDYSKKVLELDHYALTQKGVYLGNKPVVADFADSIVTAEDAGDPFSRSTFMLFLKRNAAGAFEPITGQHDSAFSVKSLLDSPRGEKARYETNTGR